MRKIVFFGIVSWLIGFYSPISAQNSYTITTVPNIHLSNAADYVTNPDGIISQSAKDIINEKIASIESVSSAEIAVVLLSSIGNEDIDDFGTRLFTHWGIGKKNDNGLLFLLVNDKREMIFRTGYGLEGVLPDAILSRVIRNDITPLLRSGDFDAGIIAGITKVCDYLNNPESVREIMQNEENNRIISINFSRIFKTAVFLFYLFISLIVAVIFFVNLISKTNIKTTNYQKYLSLDKHKWLVILSTVIFPVLMVLFSLVYFLVLKRLRTKPVACNQCGNKMLRLDEPTLLTFLTPAQRTEETIRSVDYDVWRCNQCENTETLAFKRFSKYTVCSYCNAKASYLLQDRIIKHATSYSQGLGERLYSCKNCKGIHTKLYNIPRYVSSTGSGRSFSGGGGSRGGSWGGGRTGGGGARGRW